MARENIFNIVNNKYTYVYTSITSHLQFQLGEQYCFNSWSFGHVIKSSCIHKVWEQFAPTMETDIDSNLSDRPQSISTICTVNNLYIAP